jgi:predicted amidophosphoribosyltransferase
MGDPVCWLNKVCPECGAFNEHPDQRCWRCGAAAGTSGTGTDPSDTASEPSDE